MPGVTVCTGFDPGGYGHYARNAMATFDRYWPREVHIVAYVEELVELPRGDCRSLWDIEGAKAFIKRHRAVPAHCGLSPVEGWRRKELEAWKLRGEAAWRYDTVRWFKQCFIPEHAAASMADGDVLVWLDADVVSYGKVPAGLIEELIGPSELIYLGRRANHSEIGFWAVRLNPGTRAFLSAFANEYRDDRVFELREWHSAFVFDQVRRRFEERGMRARDLTPTGDGHVWFNCDRSGSYLFPLANYTDHLKGPRKSRGRSPERR